MKWRITPIGIITIFIVFIMAQGSRSFSGQPAPAITTGSGITWSALDTVPENPQDTTKKKKKKKDKDRDKDKDTSNQPKPDTFSTFRP